jgi:hypothetical protein
MVVVMLLDVVLAVVDGWLDADAGVTGLTVLL